MPFAPLARRLAPALLAAALSLPAPAAAAAFSALHVFGDSLSDEGNLRTLTNGLVPVAPTYDAGRFSNGPTWADGLSAALGLGDSRPSLQGGTNHAFGLARSDAVAPGLGLPASINLPGQVQAYIAGPNAAPDALFAVWAGANNLLQAMAVAGGQANPVAFVTTQGQAAATAVLDQLGLLYADGAREFLVLNQPDFGRIPRFTVSPQVSGLASVASGAFNATLAQGLAGFAGLPGVSVRLLDVFGLFDTVFEDPARFGLTDLATPCVTGPVPGIYLDPQAATLGCTPAQAATRLFWDPVHPSAAGHALVAAAARAAIPAPAALGLLAAGLLGLVVVRRRG